MNYLIELYQNISESTKSNPILAGAVSLWGLGVFTFLCRNIPIKLWNFILSQTTTSLTLNNAGWSNNDLQFHSFMDWYLATPWSRWSRALSMDSKSYTSDITIGAGYGTHFFIFKYRLYWFNKSRLESAGTHTEKQQITINVFSRDQKSIMNLIEVFRYKPKQEDVPVYIYKTNCWEISSVIRKRNIDTVIIKKEIKQIIIDQITQFQSEKEWFHQRGIPYKITYVFEGIPGTGKTSFIKALASYYNRSIYQINIGMHSDSSFELAMGSVPKGSFILIEDFDSSSSVKTRTKQRVPESDKLEISTGESIKEDKNDISFNEMFNTLSLTTILNTLDGIVSLEDVIIFMTTNHLEMIDSAVLRKGRVDHIVNIPKLTDIEIKEYIKLVFPDSNFNQEEYRFARIAGCELQDLFLNNKKSSADFILSIPRST